MNSFIQLLRKSLIKTRNSVLLVAVVLGISNLASAQALSGTKTICASGCDYSSVAAAATALNSNGVNGPVIFNIAAGTYTGQVTINQFTGASANNRVVFRGQGRNTVIANAGTYALYMNYARFVDFEDVNIQNTRTNTAGSYAAYFNYTQDCRAKNVHFLIDENTTTTMYPLYLNYTLRTKISDSRVAGGYYGFYHYGALNSASYGFDSLINTKVVKYYYYGYYNYGGRNNAYIGNTFDSARYQYNYNYSYYEDGAYYAKNKILNYYLCYLYYPNQYVRTKEFIFENNLLETNTTGYYGMYAYSGFSGALALRFRHNTVRFNGTAYYALGLYMVGPTDVHVVNNLVDAPNMTQGYVAYFYKSASSALDRYEGNIWYAPKAAQFGYFGTTVTNTFNDYVNALKARGMGQYEQYRQTPFLNPTGFETDSTKAVGYGRYANCATDFNDKTRCTLFPTSGCEENSFGKGAVNAQFFGPNPAILGSPVVYRNIAKDGEPKVHAWYVNGAKVSDSVQLATQLPGRGGFDTVMLITQGCGGIDTFSSIIRVDSPSKAPKADFIANINTIKQGDRVKMFDLSQDGPASWNWEITPDSVFDGPNKVPSYRYLYGSKTSQNIELRFDQPGVYDVCLTAGNVRGSTKKCESKYIDVAPVLNMCSRNIVRSAAGTLYDAGGVNGANTQSNCNLLIDPCADSVWITFKNFNMYSGYDYIRLYEGKDNKGKYYHSTTNIGYSGYHGFTGGLYNNQFQYEPRVTTNNSSSAFVTYAFSKSVYIEMNTFPYGGQGFELEWYSTPRSEPKPTAGFEAPADICVGGAIDFIDTSKGADLEYLWDFDGDFSFFEFTGKNPLWPFFFPGQQTVTLIVSNCGGIDTFQKSINVFLPNKPSVDFEADNYNPSVNDVVYFKDLTPDCVDDYEWSFQQVGGTSNPTFALGTGKASQNCAVIFNDTGWYNVTLSAENATDKTVRTKNRLVYVKTSYCRPTVGTIIPDLGISLVKFHTVSNSTSQGVDEYGNFTPFISATLEQGVEYEITVERTTNRNEMDRAVYIDWNGNGAFDSTEMVASETASRNLSWTAKFTVPTTSKVGASVLRVAVNKTGLGNKICGQNEYGEYEDYRVFIRPDQSAPVITLTDDSVSIEQGEQFIEPGFAAEDNLDGNVTSQVVVSSAPIFSNLVPGTYVFNYNVEDAAGNKAETKNRVVVVRPDATAPEITLNGELNDSVRVFEVYSDPGIAAATDLVDGDVSPTLTTINNVNTNQLGVYTIVYNVVDFGGNIGTITRNVRVYDDVAPNVVFNGMLIDTTEIGEEYIDPSVTITDNYDQGLEPTIVTDLDINRVGTYTIQYFSADNSGNKGEDFQRTVVVLDTKAPEVTILGEETITLEVFDSYEDEGATTMDNDPINMPSLVTGGTYFTEFPDGEATKLGTYTVTYTSEDSAGNQTIATRNIEVVDTEAPVATLNGEQSVQVRRWATFNDPGVAIEDNYYSAAECTVEITGTFTENGADLPGLYTLNYIVKDGSGNVAKKVSRLVFVFEDSVTNSVGTFNAKDVKVYPNPTNSFVNIEVANITERASISIIDASGKVVVAVENNALVKNLYTVDVTGLNAGIYMVRVQTQTQNYITKLNVVK